MSSDETGPETVPTSEAPAVATTARPYVELAPPTPRAEVGLSVRLPDGEERHLAWYLDLDHSGVADWRESWFWRRLWNLARWGVQRFGPPGLRNALSIVDEVSAQLRA